jgi:hypothetical protein
MLRFARPNRPYTIALTALAAAVAGCTDSAPDVVAPSLDGSPSTSTQLLQRLSDDPNEYAVSENFSGKTYRYSGTTGTLKIVSADDSLAVEIPQNNVPLILKVLDGMSGLERGMAREAALAEVDFTPPCGNGDLSGCQMRAPMRFGDTARLPSTPRGTAPLIRRRRPAVGADDALTSGFVLPVSDPCIAIGQAISAFRNRWANSVIREGQSLSGLKDLVPAEIKNGIPTIKVPDVTKTVVDMLMKAAESWQEHIEADIMAVQWNSYGCYGRPITHGPVGPRPNLGGPGGAPMTHTCWTEMWEISYNGGLNWQPHPMTVCGWSQMN